MQPPVVLRGLESRDMGWRGRSGEPIGVIKITEWKAGRVGHGRGSDNFVHVPAEAELGRVGESGERHWKNERLSTRSLKGSCIPQSSTEVIQSRAIAARFKI